MNKNEFIYWLEGFIETRTVIGASEVELIMEKIRNLDKSYDVGYYPNPFNINPIKYNTPPRKRSNKEKEKLKQKFLEISKDINIISGKFEDGIVVNNMVGNTYYMSFTEIEDFIKKYENE